MKIFPAFLTKGRLLITFINMSIFTFLTSQNGCLDVTYKLQQFLLTLVRLGARLTFYRINTFEGNKYVNQVENYLK